MRKSKIETAETRKRIVETAAQVFLERGIDATGISDIMTAAGLTQGGFYRHFESKEALLVEAAECAYDKIIAMVANIVTGKTPRESLDAIVHIYLYQHYLKNASLCPIANLGSEISHADDQLKAVVNVGYTRMASYMAALLQQLQVRENIAVADAIVATLVGAVTVSRLSLTVASAKNVLASAQKTVNMMVDAALLVEA